MKCCSLKVEGLLLTLLLSVLLFCRCSSPEKYTYNEGSAFATTYHIVYLAHDQADYQIQIDSILDEITHALSVYDSTSVASLININKSQQTNAVFRKAFNLCQTTSDSSAGAFDITVAPLISGWGFGPKRRSELSASKIDSLLLWVGYRKVWLEGELLVKSNPAVTIDMSSVGDGLAVDEVVAFLEAKRVVNYMVEIGGEVKAKGKNTKQMVWKIGIDKPIFDPAALQREIERVVLVDGQALSTSGSYRKFFIRDGQKFSHFIDPQTGRPVTHTLLSASVICPSCAMADAFSTAFMVMGLEKSQLYLKRDKRMSAYFIYSVGDSLAVAMANNFEGYLQK